MFSLEPHRPLTNFLKWGGISFFFHVVVVIVFNLDPWPTIIRQPVVYTVTLMPVSLPVPEPQKPPIKPSIKEPPPKAVEKQKPIEKPKKDDIVEKVKKPVPKMEKPKEDPETLKHLKEAIEEIRRKAALDEIQKRVTKREKVEERPNVTPPPAPAPPSPVPPFPVTPSPLASTTPLRSESKLNEYYSLIWAKIKEEWTLPQNVVKENFGLETIIVMVIERNGRIQKAWFEKGSGNALFDQMAMRALKKAEPLPPFPRDLSENTLEIGIRFTPD